MNDFYSLEMKSAWYSEVLVDKGSFTDVVSSIAFCGHELRHLVLTLPCGEILVGKHVGLWLKSNFGEKRIN